MKKNNLGLLEFKKSVVLYLDNQEMSKVYGGTVYLNQSIMDNDTNIFVDITIDLLTDGVNGNNIVDSNIQTTPTQNGPMSAFSKLCPPPPPFNDL